MEYTISEGTRSKLESLMDASPGEAGGNRGRGGVRQICHIRVTGEYVITAAEQAQLQGFYYCVPVQYSPEDAAFTDQTAAICIEASGKKLEKGQLYTAVSYGYRKGYDVAFPENQTIVYLCTITTPRICLILCGDFSASPDGCYSLYSGTAKKLDTKTFVGGNETDPYGGACFLTALNCNTLTPGQMYFGIWNGWYAHTPLFLALGETMPSSTSTGGSTGSGGSASVVSAVSCASGGLAVTNKTLSATVKIGAVTYPVTLVLS